MCDDEKPALLKAEMLATKITLELTGEEILSIVAMLQLAYLSNPALGELGECGKSAAQQKIQEKLDPTSLLAQNLSEGWVSGESRKFEPVIYRDVHPPESFGPENFAL